MHKIILLLILTFTLPKDVHAGTTIFDEIELTCFEIYFDTSIKFYPESSSNLVGVDLLLLNVITSTWPIFFFQGLKANYEIQRNIFCIAYTCFMTTMGYGGFEIPIITDFKMVNIGLSLCCGLGLGLINLYVKYNFFTDPRYNGFEICFNTIIIPPRLFEISKKEATEKEATE